MWSKFLLLLCTLSASSRLVNAILIDSNPDRECGKGNCQVGLHPWYFEDFESYDTLSQLEASGQWYNASLETMPSPFTKFLGRFQKERGRGILPGDSRVNLRAPFYADYVVLEFDFYEIDNWQGEDCFYIYVNGEKINLNIFNADIDEQYKSGWTRYGVTWTMDSAPNPPRQIGFGPTNDQIHHVTAKIPNAVYSDSGELRIRFVTQINGDSTESSGVDNIRIQAFYSCGICEPRKQISYEDFEGYGPQMYAPTWINGRIDYDHAFTSYLGRYDVNDVPISPFKSFIVPMDAEMITVEFDLYELDNWDGRDCVFVYINGIEVFLGIFNEDSDEGVRKGTAKRGIRFESESLMGPTRIGAEGDYDDQKHHVTIHVPKKIYKRSGLVELKLTSRVNETVSNESAGYDNIEITAYYDCEKTYSPSGSPWPSYYTPTSPISPISPTHPTHQDYTPAQTPALSPVDSPAYVTPTQPSSPVHFLPTDASPVLAPTLPPAGLAPSDTTCVDKNDDVVFFVSLSYPNATCSWLETQPDIISQICNPANTAWFWCPVTCGRFA